MFLYSPPGDASIDGKVVIAPHLDVPAEESESGVTLTLGSDVEPEFKGATQFEGTLTLSQWSSRNGMCVLLTSHHAHHDLLERIRSVVPTCLRACVSHRSHRTAPRCSSHPLERVHGVLHGRTPAADTLHTPPRCTSLTLECRHGHTRAFCVQIRAVVCHDHQRVGGAANVLNARTAAVDHGQRSSDGCPRRRHSPVASAHRSSRRRVRTLEPTNSFVDHVSLVSPHLAPRVGSCEPRVPSSRFTRVVHRWRKLFVMSI
jgi:hypothetical protein